MFTNFDDYFWQCFHFPLTGLMKMFFVNVLQVVEVEMDVEYNGGFQLSIDADLVSQLL